MDSWDVLLRVGLVGWAAYLVGYYVGRRATVRRLFNLYQQQYGKVVAGEGDHVDEALLAAALRQAHTGTLTQWVKDRMH